MNKPSTSHPARRAAVAASAPDTSPPADEAPPRRVTWPERAPEVDARALDAAEGAALFVEVWHREPHPVALDDAELQRLASWVQYVAVPAGRTLIRQDEFGDYLLVVLEGSLLVERGQPDGSKARLAEARAGDMIGEMSLLDAGSRFSVVSTTSASRIAVLQAEPFERLMREEPRIALALVATLTRRLSLRVRLLSARLGALLSPA